MEQRRTSAVVISALLMVSLALGIGVLIGKGIGADRPCVRNL